MNRLHSVAVIGAGAVGSHYGGRLAQAGHDVRFLLRRDYDAVRAGGLKVTSPDGDFTLTNPTIARDSREIGPVDWVLCALKATSVEEAPALVRPCVAADTRILVLMNGLGIEERFAEWFGAERIFGGLAFTCINRGEPGHVNHLAYGQVTLGHYRDDPVELEGALALWAGSKVDVATSPCLLCARWEKLCWNVPFSGLAVAAGGITTDRIVGDPGLRAAARTLMEEVIAAGNADLAAHAEAVRLDGDGIVSRMFRLTDVMGPYRPSTMIDFVEGRPMEVEAIFGEPLRRAQRLGVEAPQLALLTALLRARNA
ncbi:MAG: 2-dehydropantoate 2-reductase [Chloroflexota bacterium]|nr:2-dehydropantoate 2-reductase [Chloroflexota bacterium]